MAIQGFSYRSCSNHMMIYAGVNDATAEIVGHPTLGPDPAGLPAIDEDDIDYTGSCTYSGFYVYEDSLVVVAAKDTYPYALAKLKSVPDPDPPPPPPPGCHLIIVEHTITPETTAGASDGIIKLTSSRDNGSSDGTEKFNLNADFNYDTEGVYGTVIGSVSTKSFTGLPQGDYTVYVRTSNTCLKTLSVVLPVEPGGGPGDGEGGGTGTYGIIYRLDFNDQDGNLLAENKYRLNIEKADYSGAITEVKGTDDPVVLLWRNESEEDPFTPVIPCELQVGLISETDQQFIDLYAASETEYRAKLYQYVSGSYSLLWAGYLQPMTLSEPYVLNENYPVSFSFIDIGGLSAQDFASSGGSPFTGRMSYLSAINTILLKTGLTLDIHESANLYTSTMDSTDADTMLDQLYFDPAVYLNSDDEPEDCLTVLKSLLRNIGCRLYQAEGRWNIELITQKLASSVLTRVIDSEGVYQSNSSLSPRIPLRKPNTDAQRVAFRDRSQSLSIPETYGEIKVTYKLGTDEDNNMLPKSKFAPEDVTNGQFDGWTVTPLSTGQGSFGSLTLSEEINGADTAIYAQFGGFGNDYIDINSKSIDLVWPGTTYALNIKFDLYLMPTISDEHIYFDFGLSLNGGLIRLNSEVGGEGSGAVTSHLSSAGQGWIDDYYNRIFFDKALSWHSVNITAIVPGEQISAINTAGAMNLLLRVRANPKFDKFGLTRTGIYTDPLDELNTQRYSAEGLGNREKYQKVRVKHDEGSVPVIRTYEFHNSTETESLPDVVHPADYGTASNYSVFKLVSTKYDYLPNNILYRALITNARIAYLPNQQPPLTEVVKTTPTSGKSKRVYEQTILHGDITDEMDLNYKHIVKGVLTYSDGTPLQGGWTRKGEGENKYLHDLLSAMYQGQLSVARWKLTGGMIPKGVTPSFFNTFQEYRTGKIYLPMSMSVDFKNKDVRVEMIEALQGTPTTDEGTPTPDPVEPPVSTREHTNEFTNEFQ